MLRRPLAPRRTAAAVPPTAPGAAPGDTPQPEDSPVAARPLRRRALVLAATAAIAVGGTVVALQGAPDEAAQTADVGPGSSAASSAAGVAGGTDGAPDVAGPAEVDGAVDAASGASGDAAGVPTDGGADGSRPETTVPGSPGDGDDDAAASALPTDLLTPEDRAAGLLSTEVPAFATGHLVVVPGQEAAPVPDRTVRSVRVEVEEGLDVDGAVFARMVMDVLNDPRGWGADGSMTFSRTDGPADLRVVLASPQQVDAMCAPLRTVSLYSCGRYGHAALNHMRWVQGTEEFTDLTQYRQYLVNHEVGHLLGRQHVDCPGAGLPAPIMQQQTIRVAPCVPNGWPFPDAA